MTPTKISPQDKLKEIEENYLNGPKDKTWLINRVKRLEEALEIYASETEEITPGPLMTMDRGYIARKALEGEE
jgi:hypothetical protein